ncbi:MAG: hypothetical protein HQ556_11575 [Candidatus Marinimicrobia bacterium]|nr:hypothetical protein [Candidatus Neomarinimicrobiota bacterium]
MNKTDRWEWLCSLDDELLQGGVILSEWCSAIVRECDMAYVGEAHLGAILTAVAGIETYLRSEYAEKSRESLFELINQSSIEDTLKLDLHKIRKYRNKWVHVGDPWNDKVLLDVPEEHEEELEIMAAFAVKALRRTIYENLSV